MKGRIFWLVSLFIACHRIIPEWEGTAPVFQGSVELQQPAVIQTRDGEWCVVFASGTKSQQTEGVLLLTRATGLHGPWSSPDTIAQVTLLCRNPRMSQMKDGLIQIVFEMGHMQDGQWMSDRLALIRSYDYGRSFSVPRPVSSSGKTGGVPLQGLVEVSHDHWIFPVLFENEKQISTGLALTEDGGETWTFSFPSVFELPIETVQLIWNSASGLIALMQMKNRDQLYYSVSRDTGKTWLDSWPINIYGSHPTLTRKTDGTLVCFYKDKTPPGFSMMRSYDHGRTFEAETALRQTVTMEKPWISFIEPDKVAMFYTGSGGIFVHSQFIETLKSPGGVSLSGDSARVIIRWNSTPLAAYYRIFRSESKNDSVWTDRTVIASVPDTKYEDLHVRDDRIYAYSVSAIASYGPEIEARTGRGSMSKTVQIDMRKYRKTGEP